jgi:hypothetical protein
MDRFKAIVPDASYHTYDNKNGHFVVQEFPEILEILAF